MEDNSLIVPFVVYSNQRNINIAYSLDRKLGYTLV